MAKHDLSKHGLKFGLEVTDGVAGQVKVRIFDFSGMVTSARKISMLSANKANGFVTIIEVKVISGHQVKMKRVKQKKNRDLEPRYTFLGQIFGKNAKNDPKTLF